MDFVEELSREKILGILRGADPGATIATARTLLECGVQFLEISLTSADALHVLDTVAAQTPDAQIGAGTVITEADVDAALAHGATYIVTPGVTASVPYAVKKGVPVLCGAMTPTEIVSAHSSGADAVKIFPAGRFGPDYMADLRGPFPDTPLVPVGGVGVDDVSAYLQQGALAVGVATPLCGNAPEGGDLKALSARAHRFLKAVESWDFRY